MILADLTKDESSPPDIPELPNTATDGTTTSTTPRLAFLRKLSKYV